MLFLLTAFKTYRYGEKDFKKPVYRKKRSEIADSEFISLGTVKTHINHILKS